jgi:hypothetical protein
MSYQRNPTAGYIEQANVTRLARGWQGWHRGVAHALGRRHSLVLGRGRHRPEPVPWDATASVNES